MDNESTKLPLTYSMLKTGGTRTANPETSLKPIDPINVVAPVDLFTLYNNEGVLSPVLMVANKVPLESKAKPAMFSFAPTPKGPTSVSAAVAWSIVQRETTPLLTSLSLIP